MKSKFEKRGRLIVVDGKEWRYKVGIQNTVCYSKSGERLCAHNANILGITYYDYERMIYKRSGGVRPIYIENWIRNRNNK